MEGNILKKVLVTGASGYVGQEVVDQLLKMNCRVTGLGRRATERKDIDFVCADLTDEKSLNNALNSEHYDWIFHIAALPGDTGDPLEMVQVNVVGTTNILNYARMISPQRVVIATSLSSYGWFPATKFEEPLYLPVDEEHPCRPKDMYSVTKRIQELLAETFYNQYGVPTVCLRLSAVVGPKGQGGGRGYWEMAEKMKEGKTVQIPHLTEDEICHYVDVRDVARLFIACGENDSANGQIFNCFGPKAVSGKEFAQMMMDVVPGIDVKCGFPWSMSQGMRLECSMDKAKRILGFNPMYDLHASLENIKRWVDGGGLEEKVIRNEAYIAGVKEV
jgi:nucleoside-diphosphate-sugar epimerase